MPINPCPRPRRKSCRDLQRSSQSASWPFEKFLHERREFIADYLGEANAVASTRKLIWRGQNLGTQSSTDKLYQCAVSTRQGRCLTCSSTFPTATQST